MQNNSFTPLANDSEHAGSETREVLSDIINNTITNPSYECRKDFHIQDVDYYGNHSAFIGTPDLILVYYHSDYASCSLKLNTHNMRNPSKEYFFEYNEFDDDIVINSISIRLLETGTIQKAANINNNSLSRSKTIELGRYFQNSIDDSIKPINWILLEQDDSEALLISECILDYIQYGQIIKWDYSNICRWLNEHFYYVAFNEMERKALTKWETGESVMLLSLEEYEKYHLINKEIGYAKYTDYSRAKAAKYLWRTIREPYGHWWTRTPSKGNHIWHIHISGIAEPSTEPYFDCGVRPVIRVNLSVLNSILNEEAQ